MKKAKPIEQWLLDNDALIESAHVMHGENGADVGWCVLVRPYGYRHCVSGIGKTITEAFRNAARKWESDG